MPSGRDVFTFKIPPDERERFVKLCRQLDTTAARELRRMIREFCQQHSAINPPAESGSTDSNRKG